MYTKKCFRSAYQQTRQILAGGVSYREFQISQPHVKNHYDALGITPKATQNDIKTAYYKLSMLYHPDKNEGCSDASQKFRDITTAYEVLGNYRLRKLYDKGIIHTAGPEFTAHSDFKTHDEEEDDAQTKFYKAHMKRSKAPNTGRTPIYNFDVWSREHYGTSFERSQAAKNKYERKIQKDDFEKNNFRKEMLVVCAMSFIFLVIYAFYEESSHDSVRTIDKKTQ